MGTKQVNLRASPYTTPMYDLVQYKLLRHQQKYQLYVVILVSTYQNSLNISVQTPAYHYDIAMFMFNLQT
jgi:hypothetical protein